MRVVGRTRLEEFASQHADVRAQLDAWLCEVEEADWKSPSDVKARFPSASILSDERIVFNLKGNRYRLEVKFSCAVKTVLITRIGTHAEYSKWTF
jgi:mRNA interferase HigB